MKAFCLLLGCILCVLPLSAQFLYGITENNQLYRIEVSTCSESFMTNVNSPGFTDISFHPNGNLYGISSEGGIFLIDTLTGTTNLVYSLPFDPDMEFANFNALTVTEDGVFYASGTHRVLYSYDLASDTEMLLGMFNLQAAGDLTPYNGNLYMTTTSNSVLLVNTTNVASSGEVINDATDFLLYGFSTYVGDCGEQYTFAITSANEEEDSKLFSVQWDNSALQFVCDLQDSYFGSTTKTEFITAPEPLLIEGLNEVISNCGTDDNSITVLASGGTGALVYSLDGVSFQTENTFSDLMLGNYTVVVQDENDCTINQDVELITSIPPIVAELDFVSTSCGENNGAIIVNASGGIGDLMYSINGTDYQSEASFDNLVPDEYVVYVLDEVTCIATAEAFIEGSPDLSITRMVEFASDCGANNGSLYLELDADFTDLQLQVNDINYPAFSTIDNLGCGDYALTITDQFNCEIDTSFTIIQKECSIYIPNVFSPNGDGSNDVFAIYPHPMFKGTFDDLKIFSRWGELVYEIQNFEPSAARWNGNFLGQQAQEGVFTYFLKVTEDSGRPRVLSGDVTLLR